MTSRIFVSAGGLAVLLAFANAATAQEGPAATQDRGNGDRAERRGRVYASALLTLPRSQGLTDEGDHVYVLPPGGFSVGWSALGGVFVAPRASVEFEVSQTGILKRTQRARYNTTYHEERRDTFFTTAVRLHARPGHAVDIEPVLGFDVVKEERWSATDHTSYVDGPVTSSPRFRSVGEAVAGFSAGADLRVGSGRAALVASFRVHRTFWGEGSDFGHEKEWTIRPGAGIRVTF